MFGIISELLREFSETGDPALDQEIQDVRRKQANNPNAAKQQIDRMTKQRMNQVSSRIRTLMLRKQQFNAQIDKQIEMERQREAQANGTSTQTTT